MTETSVARPPIKERISVFGKSLFLRLKKLLVYNKLISFLVITILVLSGIVVLKNSDVVRFNQFQQSLVAEEKFEKLVIPEREPPFFELTTRETRRFGILPQETLILKSRAPVSEEILVETMISSVAVTINKVSDREFHVTPRSILDLDEPLSVQLLTKDIEIGGQKLDRNYSWSFQSQGKFRVTSTIPGNEKTEVPLNTGIEFTFSQDGFEDPTKYISIEPKIAFRTETVDETFAIIPSEPLQPTTVYTVTLKRGLRLQNRNDQIDEEVVFSFQTQEKPEVKSKPRLYVEDTFVEASPDKVFGTKVNYSNINTATKIDAVIYRFPSVEQFYATRKEYDEFVGGWREYYPERHNYAEGLPEIRREDVTIQEQDYVKYIQLSQPYEPGFYLVEFEVDGEPISSQVWYQSTELSGYIALGKEQTIVWTNNTATNSVSAGANVRSLTTGETWQTGAEGVAKFPTSQAYFNEKTHYFEVRDVIGNIVILPLGRMYSSDGPDTISNSDYWSYLYTEKVFYASDDTVNYWGMIKQRDTGGIPEIKIELVNSNRDILFTSNKNPSSEGTFIGDIPLENAAEGWYSIRMMVGDTEIKSLSFSIVEYTKPDMKLEVNARKKAIFVDETVEFITQTSFFDGTPGAHIDLTVYESDSGNNKKITTDKNGVANYTYTPVSYRSEWYYPRYEGITVKPALVQDSILEGQSQVMVYGSRVMMNAEKRQVDNRAYLNATVNAVDLSRINDGDTDDPKGNAIVDKEVSIVITENWTERIEDGSYYNFIEKITYPRYRYERHSKEIDNFTRKTNNDGTISHEFTMAENRSYHVKLEVKDDHGRSAMRTLYYYSTNWSDEYTQASDDTVYIDLLGKDDSNTFSIGETVEVELIQQEKRYQKAENDRFLYTIASRGNQDVTVSSSPTYSFTFDSNDKPNVYVSAVIFDGDRYVDARAVCRNGWSCWGYYNYWTQGNLYSGIQVTYDTTDSTLDMEISSPRLVYAPGDEVEIEVFATQNGVAVPGVRINLAMMDEALAAIGGVREPSVVTSIYTSTPHQIYFVYTSHDPILPYSPGAEKGGGGGDRSLFKDTAFFAEQVTNVDGKARFRFVLPDNITTWITYAQGISGNISVGQTNSRIVATKDFFVTSKVPSSYLTSDKAHASSNSFGVALSEDEEVSLSFIVKDDDREIRNLEEKIMAFEENHFPLPELQAGTYEVITRGSYKEYDDGISLPVDVITTRIKQPYSVEYVVEESSELDTPIKDSYLAEEPVTLVVSDVGKGRYFDTLNRYCRYQSNRIERRISRMRATQSLKNYFDYDSCAPSELELFQSPDGGISLVKWGGSNLDTTLWSAYVEPESFDTTKMITYFGEVLANNQSSNLQRIKAAWGMSILGESKISTLQSFESVVYTLEERQYLALAFASIGDTERARNMYLDILADYAYTLPPYIRVDSSQNAGNTNEKYVVDTSIVLLLGELVDDTYNEGLYFYIADFRNYLEHYLIDLSEITYIESQLQTLPNSNTIYTMHTADGIISEEIDRGRSELYEFDSSDLDAFRFELSDGRAELAFNYKIGPDTLIQKKPDNRLSVNRKIENIRDGDIQTGDLVRITLDLSLDMSTSPRGSYTIRDILPSGLTYVSNPYVFGFKNATTASEVEDKVILFRTYNSPSVFIGGRHTITYYARASSAGTYKAERATFQSERDLKVLTITDEQSVTIK